MVNEHLCDNGWIHIQHPMKPPGVIMQSRPCHVCNPSGDKPPFQNAKITVKETTDEDCIASSVTTFIDSDKGL